MKKLFLLLLMLVISVPMHIAHAEETQQVAKQLDTQVRVQLQYLLALPKDYDTQDRWPLLLFLHGAGERGSNLDLVKVHGPPLLISQGKQFPMIVVSPQCPEGETWEPYKLIALLDDLQRNYKVDANRIYVTGLSMGGFASWQLAARIPQRLAAVAPICGGGEPFFAHRMAKLPIWAFHGAKDEGVPPELSTSMIEAIKKRGGNPKLTIYPEAGHDSWTETYNNPAFYEWLLAQKKSS